nr:hypothetical protein [Aliiruegeria lutimaris]
MAWSAASTTVRSATPRSLQATPIDAVMTCSPRWILSSSTMWIRSAVCRACSIPAPGRQTRKSAPPNSGQYVPLPDRRSQQIGYLDQETVPGMATMTVLDLLEVVETDHDERSELQRRNPAFNSATVEKPRHRIPVGFFRCQFEMRLQAGGKAIRAFHQEAHLVPVSNRQKPRPMPRLDPLKRGRDS